MDDERKIGFPPVYDENSRILILGSFPSVKSRAVSFYYGNERNRFWKMLCGYFEMPIPSDTEGKRAFLLKQGVALWDAATSCEILGSADSSLKNAEIADLQEIFQQAKLEKILLNGSLAYELFLRRYADCPISFEKMPSTSPANPRYDERIWKEALDDVYGISR